MDGTKIKVLAIDDQDEILQILKKNLPRMGPYEVITSLGGREGLRLAKTARPDVILLDVVMPGFSGTEVGEALQDDPVTEKIPVIFMTGLIRADEIKENAEGGGGREYLAKPFPMTQVVAKIQKVLGRSS